MDPARHRVTSGVVALSASCHPGPVVAVTGVMTALAATAGRGAAGAAAVGGAVLAGQLSVGWSNDYLDGERDRAACRADKPVALDRIPRGLVGAAALTALVLAAPLSLLSGWRAAVAHLVGVAAAWGYNLRLKATRWSVVPYVVAFGLLPGLIAFGLPGHPAPPVWAMAGSALLGAAAHFANVLPDLAADRLAGIDGLPQRLGRRRSTVACAVLLLAASGTTLLASGAFPLPAAAAVLAGDAAALATAFGYAGHRPTSRAPFGVTLVIAAVDCALLVAAGTSLH